MLKFPGSIPGVAGDFSVASEISMCPGVNSASNSEYQVNPEGKAGPFMSRLSRNLGALTFCNPVGVFRPVMAQLHVHFYMQTDIQ